ncbi:hypothetical protein HU724_014000 [Pseudomonas iranensis]|uniref:hypothetical protein n=1 Tax=Pseudomonas iranensis TaxID=2745503 RepID=UPI0016495D7E|nr:hypothetical protein [Pseudomonas iranensis]QXI20160.1 hypothetical protein HU724_014000 [Pseudomonas iranensis]
MERKYVGITDEAVDTGIATRSFSEAEIRQIRDSSGRFVKHIKTQSHPRSLLPASVIQVNQTYVYQADLRPVMQAIARTRDVQIADDLSERYRLVLSKLERFLNHRRILDSLNEAAGDAAEIFDLRLTPILEKLGNSRSDVPAGVALIDMLRAQVNIEFVYLLSTFWIDRKSVSIDTGLPRRLEGLERRVRRALEQLVAYQYQPNNRFVLRDSLYGKYLLQGDNGISYLQQFLEHDSRFESYDEFMGMIFNERLEYTGNHDYRGDRSGDASFGFNFTVDQIHFKDDERHSFACSLRAVLCDIPQVRSILEELKDAHTIDPEDIQPQTGADLADPIRLMAIPLLLPKPASE